MKPRIIKKVSKRLVEIAPKLFNDAWKGGWIDSCMEWDYLHCSERDLGRPLSKNDIKTNTYLSKCKVNHVYSVGFLGFDLYGDMTEYETVLDWFLTCYDWLALDAKIFNEYPEGHKFHGMPDARAFKPTTRNLIKLAKQIG